MSGTVPEGHGAQPAPAGQAQTPPLQYQAAPSPQPQYQAAPYPQPQYSQYGQPQYQPPRGLSIASMVLGIVGLVAGWFLLGVPSIVGVILGHMGLRREPAGRPFAVTGLVTGYIGIAFGVIGAIVLVASFVIPFLILGGVAAGSATY
ncbi:DUF4190 domain-containing protein [Herbiconiux sp. L3-i23]|uniref:DUF4190 domain-containing protein n=1 Tax=Herbiconiux sp. L3-i23 TaxID=2905871 RepID=UPI00206A7BAA|nr:DUF4190 domain-containing protein [Herbiconiux sp. L3-i23]BDI23828.1 hypothetical protein L3i23_26040 [Herbiconiux sp. L3-i23]